MKNTKKPTLVNIAQGVAETQLTNQIRRRILLAFPIEDRDRGESGRQIARYLQTPTTIFTRIPNKGLLFFWGGRGELN